MLLPVNDAAAALGISVSAVRRRLKSGQLRGQRQPTKQGHAWLVDVPDDRVVDSRVGDRQPSSRVGDERVGDYAHQETPAAPQTAILGQRAAEMAAYSTALLAPLHAQLREQAERIGHLEEQLEQARLFGNRKTEDAPRANWPTGRSWWQRLVFG